MVVTRRLTGASSLNWRSDSATEPTVWPSEMVWASAGVTSTVTDLATAGFSAPGSSDWSMASTLTLSATTWVEEVCWPDPDPELRVSRTSTRSPGRMKPATPATSLERMEMARMPGVRPPERLSRPPGPLIAPGRTGSLG